LAERLAALGSLARPGALRQHGVMARSTARRWGLEPEQLRLVAAAPAEEQHEVPASRPAPKRSPPPARSPSMRVEKASPRDTQSGPASACRRCGGELEVQGVEETS